MVILHPCELLTNSNYYAAIPVLLISYQYTNCFQFCFHARDTEIHTQLHLLAPHALLLDKNPYPTNFQFYLYLSTSLIFTQKIKIIQLIIVLHNSSLNLG